ncbi:ABC transporter ATP-binding protein [Lactobacillus kimbladii]|uniref:ATP-binding cassette domain-containing protein n=1 Tax=Lactobacillus kimbladii TaxID=1218506 RepID=UPI00164F479A|nr:ABC transporter ATP-binding protein [Lactobacillus kimbladii]MBC6341561.1 ABC transporter ATP-binding protein [Lactobacillus kimbladii]
MVGKYLRQVINRIGIPKIALFCVFLFLAYAVYFAQPYLITELFQAHLSTNCQILLVLALAVSLMMMPLINSCNNSFIQAVRKFSKQILWESVVNKPFSYFSDKPVGKVQSYIKDVSFACRELEQSGLGVVVQMSVMLIMYTIMLSIQNIFVGFLYLFFFVSYMLISVWMARKNRDNVAASLKSASKVNEYIIDYYSNIETILATNSKDFEEQNMDKILNDEQNTFIKVQKITNEASLFQQFLIVILACIITVLGQFLIGTKENQALSLILILLYSIVNLSGFGTQYLAIEEFLNRIRSGLSELEYGKNAAKNLSAFKFDQNAKTIAFKQISYSYKNKQDVFQNLDLEFKKGKMTALVGPNGTGKSTMLKLLTGFYQPQSGQIILPFAKQPKLLYLPQSAQLFNRSIMANICYPNNKVAIEEVFKLIEEINLKTLIHTEKDLTAKTPGDFKNKISGGEKQKILFLRAIVSKPQIILLDEFTSNLDENTITIVYQMIKKYLPNATIISVVHRFAELKYYDEVVNLKKD